MPCLPAEAEKLEIDLHVAHRRSVISTFVPFGVVEFDNEEQAGLLILYSYDQPPVARLRKVVKENLKKKKGHHQKSDEKIEEDKEVVHKVVVQTDHVQENVKSHVKDEDKEVVKNTTEKHNLEARPVKRQETAVTRTMKFIFGEDIRWAQLPVNCSLTMIRDTIKDRFPQLKSVLEPSYDDKTMGRGVPTYVSKSGEDIQNVARQRAEPVATRVITVEDWLVQFARLFKNPVGFDSDAYLYIHEVGMKLYSEAMEDTTLDDDAQELFEIAADKFQEMAASALFNWGNVHMSRARKRVSSIEDGSRESLESIKSAYDWAQTEYTRAETRYEEAVRIKLDFYERLLALGYQQFEQAKLHWCYSVATNKDLDIRASEEVLQYYNKVEDSMEKGMLMWEGIEKQRLNGLSKFDNYKEQLEKMDLHNLFRYVSPEEAEEQASKMRLQVYLLWGTLLYERSVVEYKLGLPTWEECLGVAVEKLELAGDSSSDIGVMIKNHSSNTTALGGFKIDEMVQAWNKRISITNRKSKAETRDCIS
ncbi:hypothetical protein AHAS_Ahas12G0083300 [Arachis hypogaea]